MAFSVAHAKVLITGGASGMGRLYAERAVREGAESVTLWDIDAIDRKSTRLNSSHIQKSRMPSSA